MLVLRIRIFVIVLMRFIPLNSIAEKHTFCPSIHEKPVAIFIGPTAEEIESMKQETGEDFYVIADDAMCYQWQAMELLEKMKFPFCFTEEENHTFLIKEKSKKFSLNEK